MSEPKPETVTRMENAMVSDVDVYMEVAAAKVGEAMFEEGRQMGYLQGLGEGERLVRDRSRERERLASLAGDLWSQLENCRSHWETQEFGPLCAMYIAEYEDAAAAARSVAKEEENEQ